MIDTITANKQGILAERDEHALRVGHLPFYYHVHLNTPCNQKCIMCVPNGNHGRDVLPLEGFVRFFEQIEPYAEHITLIGGEPFMYPWIDDVLELLAAHPVAVTINTNATMLDHRITPRLLALHELYLKTSIDAVDRATYRRIRGRDQFERVTGNLRRFADASRDRPGIHLVPVYVVMRENLDEVVPFVRFAASLSPLRIEFHPVRHVREWVVSNGTGWTFDGAEQVCETFAGEYNDVMRDAIDAAEREGVECEVHFL
jgi:molybdenum cofactor biosynthesis enzyme MoaA